MRMIAEAHSVRHWSLQLLGEPWRRILEQLRNIPMGLDARFVRRELRGRFKHLHGSRAKVPIIRWYSPKQKHQKAALACIVALGQQQYRLNNSTEVHRVGDAEDDVLQAYLDNVPKWKAAERLITSEIENRSRRYRIAEILKGLKEGPLGEAIDLPGKGKKGTGYAIRILCSP
jgi:hypothetical protein